MERSTQLFFGVRSAWVSILLSNCFKYAGFGQAWGSVALRGACGIEREMLGVARTGVPRNVVALYSPVGHLNLMICLT